jgi:hypothetical protein
MLGKRTEVFSHANTQTTTQWQIYSSSFLYDPLVLLFRRHFFPQLTSHLGQLSNTAVGMVLLDDLCQRSDEKVATVRVLLPVDFV